MVSALRRCTDRPGSARTCCSQARVQLRAAPSPIISVWACSRCSAEAGTTQPAATSSTESAARSSVSLANTACGQVLHYDLFFTVAVLVDCTCKMTKRINATGCPPKGASGVSRKILPSEQVKNTANRSLQVAASFILPICRKGMQHPDICNITHGRRFQDMQEMGMRCHTRGWASRRRRTRHGCPPCP